jgi:MerR family copper efflux transcriptional regulator
MKIGELSKKSELPASTIRFYEKQGLLPGPRRSQSGYRVYSDDILERIQFIKLAQMLGFKLQELPALMRNGENLDHDGLLLKLDTRQKQIETQISELESSKQKIISLKQQLKDSWAKGECACTQQISEIFGSSDSISLNSESKTSNFG